MCPRERSIILDIICRIANHWCLLLLLPSSLNSSWLTSNRKWVLIKFRSISNMAMLMRISKLKEAPWRSVISYNWKMRTHMISFSMKMRKYGNSISHAYRSLGARQFKKTMLCSFTLETCPLPSFLILDRLYLLMTTWQALQFIFLRGCQKWYSWLTRTAQT